ncbi:MAG: ABC transporter ATP-binding protein [Acidobacteriota bacterium]|nr:ABC transporter ATP-binding protein [Acidobacteriota bacterium]
MSDPFIIETAGLHKNYDGIEALRGLTLQVPAGSIFGFLGRNGAGKTTTIKILLGLAKPTSGKAHVFGLDADDQAASVAIRRRTAFVSDEKDLYDYMTVGEMIRFTASFFPKWRADMEERQLRRFDLRRERPIKGLSRGMRTKLSLLLALCRGAELLILDEPTSGLDPVVTEEVLQALVSGVAGEAMTVFFSSHQISEVDQIADHVAIIDRGQLAISGALDDLRQNYRRIQLVFEGDAPNVKFHPAGVRRVQRKGRVLTILSSAGTEQILDEAKRYRPVSIDVVPVTLKDIFLETVAAED